jgi:hypothetical protein
MDRRVIAAAAALFVIAGAVMWIPWATEDRGVIASTPVPPPLFSITPANLKGGSQACLDQVTFDPNTQVGEIGANSGGKPGPELSIRATAPSYLAMSRIPAGWTDNEGMRFDLEPPRRPVIGELCIRNTGKRTISLNGTNEFRTMGRPRLFIDGQPQDMDTQLKFYARKPRSYASRAGEIFGHATTFAPDFLPKGVLMAIGLLGLIGIPAGIFGALAIAAREDDEDTPEASA